MDSGNKVYFTASSPYGSTVFSWHEEDGITRLSASDTIIEAIPINNQKLLVCELDKHSYSYKIIPIEKIFEYPEYYSYPFKTASSILSQNNHLTLEEEHFSPLSTLKSKTITNIDSEEKENPLLQNNSHFESLSTSKYNHFKHLNYIGIKLDYLHDPLKGHTGLLSMSFQDPLEINTLTVGTKLSKKNKSYNIFYSNKKYILNWRLKYEFRQGKENFFGSESDLYVHEVSPSIYWEFFRKGYWSLGAETAIKGGNVSFLTSNISGFSIYYILKQSFILNYEQKYSLNFEPHRKFFIEGSGNFFQPLHSSNSNLEIKASSALNLHWGQQFYTKNFVFLKKAKKEQSIPFKMHDTLHFNPNLENYTPSFTFSKVLSKETNHLIGAGMNLKKYFHTPLYFSRIPFSLRALAPSIAVEYIDFLNHKTSFHNQFFMLIGKLHFHILALHKVPFFITVKYGLSLPLTAQTKIHTKAQHPFFLRRTPFWGINFSNHKY